MLARVTERGVLHRPTFFHTGMMKSQRADGLSSRLEVRIQSVAGHGLVTNGRLLLIGLVVTERHTRLVT